jgi:hypothetical protein
METVGRQRATRKLQHGKKYQHKPTQMSGAVIHGAPQESTEKLGCGNHPQYLGMKGPASARK